MEIPGMCTTVFHAINARGFSSTHIIIYIVLDTQIYNNSIADNYYNSAD